MNWYKIAKEKDEFIYSNLIKDFWNLILDREKDKVDIEFNLENNDSVDNIRYVDSDDEFITVGGAKYKYRIYAQLMCAGGDWENPVYYFRCQAASKFYLDSQDKWDERWDKGSYTFIYIPSKGDGNHNLVQREKGAKWVATDGAETKAYDFKDADKKKLWDSLKKKGFKRIKEYYKELYSDYDVSHKEVSEKHNVYEEYNLTDIFRKQK